MEKRTLPRSGRPRLSVMAASVVMLLLFEGQSYAESAVFRRVERRRFPTGWTQPTVTPSSATGGGSFKPSIPEDFDERETGGLLDVRSVTVHVNSMHGRVPRSKPQLQLVGRNGRAVTVKTGIWTPVNGRFLRVIVEDGSYVLESLSPRRRWRMLRAGDRRQ